MKNILFFGILYIIALSSSAQLIIDGQIRPRTEYRYGYGQPRADTSRPAFFTTQRTRLGIKHIKDSITTRITVQDCRIWGEAKGKADVASLGIFEAYVKLGFSKYWSITVGRQAIDIDNKRLFSAANWNQVSTSHDGVTIDFKKESINFKMITAFNQAGVSNFFTDYSKNITNYKFLNTIWLEKKFKNISIANLTITDGYQKEGTIGTDYFRCTSGLVAIITAEKLSSEVRGFYQTGKRNTGQDIAAYYGNLIVGYIPNSNLKVTTGIEYMSGNDMTDTNNTVYNSFDILYGRKHWSNGMMDYFSTPSTTKSAGLINPYARIDFTKIKNWKLRIYYHYMMLENNYVHEENIIDKFLAHEIDFIADLNINKTVSLQMAYGLLFGDETLEIIKGGNSDLIQHYAFVMLTIKPVFFKSE